MSKTKTKGLVEYFEVGCVCVLTGLIPKHTTELHADAEQYYMERCTCSRHPESAARECWDQ